MQGQVTREAAAWGDLVRGASGGFAGPWPRVVVFQGSSDTTVSPVNQAELVKQWTDVHGLGQQPDVADEVAGQARTAFVRDGLTVVETYTLPGLGHAVAVGADPEEPCGTTGAYLADREFCAAYRAFKFFGLATLAPPVDGGAEPGPDGGTPEAGGGGGGCRLAATPPAAAAPLALAVIGLGALVRRSRRRP
jgi:MYXO-CTERM domain-containing protein